MRRFDTSTLVQAYWRLRFLSTDGVGQRWNAGERGIWVEIRSEEVRILERWTLIKAFGEPKDLQISEKLKIRWLKEEV